MTAALIAKLESASEGSRELDLTIATRLERKLWLRGSGHNTVERNGRQVVIPHYTTSIDAALALAERVLPAETFWELSHLSVISGNQMFHAQVYPPRAVVELSDFYGHARSPALAICAAILRASAAEGAG